MTLGIVLLDVLELGRLAESGDIPVKMPQPFVQRRVSGSDITDVAFEVLDVDGVKADNGGVETDVCLRDGFAEVIRCCVLGQMAFGAV